MPVTSPNAIFYPASTDDVRVWEDMQALADSVQTALTSLLGAAVTVENGQETDQTTASTTFQAGGPPLCEVIFVAAPSGKAYVTVSGELASTAAGVASLAAEVYLGTSSAGTLIKAATQVDALRVQASNNMKGSRRTLLTGLTPGSTYYVQTKLQSNVGTETATAFSRYLIVEPALA